MTANDILTAFIPIFVTMDALGLIPIYVGLTYDLTEKQREKIIFQSIFTALTLAIGFIFLGKLIFKFLGITMADFMVAGGIILLCIGILDLFRTNKPSRVDGDEVGAVPLGTPLMVGPGVLTTSLMLVDQCGLSPTLISVTLNVLLTALAFIFAQFLVRVFGYSGLRALSKIMAVLLAAIAVMMIRKGIFIIVQQ